MTALQAAEPEVIVRVMLATDRAIDLFLADLPRRGYSERTRATYSRTLDKFNSRLPADTDVAKVTVDDCRRFLDGYNRRAAGTRAHTFSVLSSFFKWLALNEKIARNPLDRLERPKRIPAADLDVVTISTEDVQRLMLHARSWPEKLALGVLVYMGPRRHAVALLRLSDYDRARGRIRFREKGGKVIWKTVPEELDQLLEAALAAGAIEDGRRWLPDRTQSPYLVPPERPLQNRERDDRVIWRLVKDVAERAGVVTHVHALRAAFAVAYLEQNPGDVEALRLNLGHRQLATTQTYLRKLNAETAMARNRSLSWGVAMADETAVSELPQFADERLAVSQSVGAGGFEPPFASPTAKTLVTPTTKPGETP
jgi:site-specific recombinase XerD